MWYDLITFIIAVAGLFYGLSFLKVAYHLWKGHYYITETKHMGVDKRTGKWVAWTKKHYNITPPDY